MFFYKSMGPVIAGREVAGEDEAEEPQGVFNEHLSLDGDQVGPMNPYPMEVDQYMLGGYGSIRTKGKDVLGDEPNLEEWHGLKWTRSAYSTTDLAGSPFSFFRSSGQWGVDPGNPNGICDGLILVLMEGLDEGGDK